MDSDSRFEFRIQSRKLGVFEFVLGSTVHIHTHAAANKFIHRCANSSADQLVVLFDEQTIEPSSNFIQYSS